MGTKYWTAERVIAAMHKWNNRYGRAPYSTEWFKSNERGADGYVLWPSTSIVQREFGTWKKGILAAGLTPPPSKGGAFSGRKPKVKRAPRGHWTKETVISLVVQWMEEHRQPPAINEWRGAGRDYPDASTVFHLFGSWNKMIREAGFIPRPAGVTARHIAKYLPLPRKKVASE